MAKKGDSAKRIHKDSDVAAAIVAQMYFLHGPHTLDSIGSKLGVDKATVSRHLKRARELGLVDIQINLPQESSLEVALKSTLDLIEAAVFPIVLPEKNEDKFMFHRLLGRAAARRLEEKGGPISDGSRIGISCGATLREFVLALTPNRYRDMTISQLTVEAEQSKCLDVAPFTLVGTLSGKWGGGTHKAYAVQPLPDAMFNAGDDQPGWTESYKVCREKIMEMAEKLDIAIMGVGHFDGETNSGSFFEVLPDCIKNFTSAGTVGEICNRPFDARGNDLTDQIEGIRAHVDGVEIEQLKQLVAKNRKVVVIAGGLKKVKAISVVLRSKIANCLITDTATAERLLEMAYPRH